MQIYNEFTCLPLFSAVALAVDPFVELISSLFYLYKQKLIENLYNRLRFHKIRKIGKPVGQTRKRKIGKTEILMNSGGGKNKSNVKREEMRKLIS